MEYGVLGVGAIGAAIVTGLCEGVDDAPAVLLSPRNAATAAGLAERFPTVGVAADNQAVVDGAAAVIVCVRPPDAPAVLSDLRFPRDRVVISAVAGLDVETIRRLAAPATEVARAVPLPSVARRECVTPVHPPNRTAAELFDRLGETLEIADIKSFEAMSAASATVAAHFRYLTTIADWLESQGVSSHEATQFVGSLFAALAEPTRSADSFEHLANEHATPGGYNEQFARGLEDAGTYAAVTLGLQRMLDRLRQT